MKPTRPTINISARDRYEKILLREQRLNNSFSFRIENPEEKLFGNSKRFKIPKRTARVVFVNDDSDLQKKVSLVLRKELEDVHIFQATNMAQALIEMELREYDILVLNLSLQNLFPEYFVEVMQRQYSYINILFLGEMPECRNQVKTEGKFIHIPQQIHQRGISRILKSLFQKHNNYRKQSSRSKSISPVDQKYFAFKQSA